MKKIDVGQTINTLANLGVIAGIAFLAVEVSQNRSSLDEANAINRAAVTSAAVEHFNSWRTQLVQDEEVAELWLSGASDRELEPADQRKFGQLCANLMWTYIMIYERFTLLGLDDRAQGAIEAWRELTASRPGIRKCWLSRTEEVEQWGYGFFVRAVAE